jgi:hypothetical protein
MLLLDNSLSVTFVALHRVQFFLSVPLLKTHTLPPYVAPAVGSGDTAAMDNFNTPSNSTLREEADGVTYEAIQTEKPRRSTDTLETGTNRNQTAYTPGNHSEPVGANSHGGVNISQAEADFAELNKALSHASRISRRSSRVPSHKGGDVEKAADSDSSSDEQFDLEAVLRGNRDEEEAAGIKSKHVGVVWENLTVSGIGGVKNFVKTFPDAFVDFVNVPRMIMDIFGLGKKGREFNILKDFKGVAKPGEMVLVLGR